MLFRHRLKAYNEAQLLAQPYQDAVNQNPSPLEAILQQAAALPSRDLPSALKDYVLRSFSETDQGTDRQTDGH